jgi:hypothetical protein
MYDNVKLLAENLYNLYGTYMDKRSGYVYRQRGGGRRNTTLWYCKDYNLGCMAKFTKNDDQMYFWDTPGL